MHLYRVQANNKMQQTLSSHLKLVVKSWGLSSRIAAPNGPTRRRLGSFRRDLTQDRSGLCSVLQAIVALATIRPKISRRSQIKGPKTQRLHRHATRLSRAPSNKSHHHRAILPSFKLAQTKLKPPVKSQITSLGSCRMSCSRKSNRWVRRTVSPISELNTHLTMLI